MADLAADHSHDPAVRLIAFDIASTQNNQVGRMQGWLALWGLPLSGGTPMAWMGGTMPGMAACMGPAADADTAMPGMASRGRAGPAAVADRPATSTSSSCG